LFCFKCYDYSNDEEYDGCKFSSSTHEQEERAFAKLFWLDIVNLISYLQVSKCKGHEWDIYKKENVEKDEPALILRQNMACSLAEEVTD
jgi:hypothetical protein